MAPIPAIRNRFQFDENIGEKPPLPRSDYYRAQHLLDAIWSQIGPRYFANRPQPTFDPQIRAGGLDPLDPHYRLGGGWAGLAYPRRLLAPWDTLRLPVAPGANESAPPPPGLPQPGVYGLDARTVANLAHPNAAVPGPPPVGLNRLPLRLPQGPAPRFDINLSKPRLVARGDVLPPAPEPLRDVAGIAVHEWAHQFQSPRTVTRPVSLEGGAEAFSQAVTGGALNRLGLPANGSGWVAYPDRVAYVNRHWPARAILSGQFRY